MEMTHNHREHSQKTEEQAHAGHPDMLQDFKRRFWISLIFTVPVLLLSRPIQNLLNIAEISFAGDVYLLFALASAVFFYGGWPFLKGLAEEIRAKTPGMMTLVGLAIGVAYVYSGLVAFGLKGEVFFWELATLIDVMLLGHFIEMKSVLGASKALEELAELLPKMAHKIMPDGSAKDAPLAELAINDQVIIKPGEKMPADGVILDGETSVNESMLTGESKPVYKKIGDEVIGGSINGEGSITVAVKKTGNESFIAQVIKLVREAQQSKSKTQDLANRAALWLTAIAVSAGVLTILAWLLIEKTNFAFALERAVTVIVIACPHALGLAVPLVVAVSTSIAAKNGLLIRNRKAFEQARKIDAVIFDKTGTLTEGKFGVTDTVSLSPSFDKNEVIKYAASVESRSEHLIAKAIAAGAAEILPAENFKAIPGKGAEAKIGGKSVKIASPAFLRELNLSTENETIKKLYLEGKTVVFVIIDGGLAGAIALADIIRPEAKKAVAALKNSGIKVMMLTGDNKEVAKWVAEETGIDEYFAEVLPEEKAKKVKEVRERKMVVAMVGDGINDAPALAQADVGIAIGAGTNVAAETSDIILVKNNPMDVAALVRLAKSTYKKMVQNLFWATGYNIVAIPLAAGALYGFGILLSPALGALFMSLSTVIVAVNAKLLRVR